MTFPVVLAVAGFVFVLIGLLGKIRIKDFEAGNDNTTIRVIVCIFGVLMLAVAFQVYRSDQQPSVRDSNVAATSQPPAAFPAPNDTNSTHAGTPTPTQTPTRLLPKPHILIEIIVKKQQENVRESYGEAAGQNFSDQDLREFIRKEVPAQISRELKTDSEFLEVVLVIKHMDPIERQKLLNEGLNKYKRTWAQMGRIDREGQTEAGQTAEKMIAKTIVDLVKDLSKRSDDNLSQPTT
jgi:hypothetical protein